MQNKTQITILKFGSSVLRSESDLPRVVHEIYRAWRRGAQVLVVVSAFGNTTDQLLNRAANIRGQRTQRDESTLAALLATGETTAAALLGLTLSKVGIPAKVLDPAQAGLRTAGDGLDAELMDADIRRLCAELNRAVVVLPGFVGRDEAGATTLLGRGGSDLTALFLAHRLGGRCILVKDVDGLYASDPAHTAVRPARYVEIRYETAIRIGGRVVQPKAVRFAASKGLRFTVTAVGASVKTLVGSRVDRLESAESTARPLRVALLGCGTVGHGVYQRFAAMPEFFTVTGVGVRDRERARAAGVPDHLVTSDLEELIDQPCEVVVELIGGVDQARKFIKHALISGRHVVTANKALMAAESEQLEAFAARRGVTLSYSAAVGGVLPALECVEAMRAKGTIKSFSGVLNGTANFVLNRLAEGEELSAAVKTAQDAGFAEADPRVDLDGTDTAQKLILLARKAFGISIPFEAVDRTGIDPIDPQWVLAAHQGGHAVRLICSCRLTLNGLEASVEPVELPHTHPLASTAGAENRLLIEPTIGEPRLVCGQGAGRWPTTEAVIADLFDVQRAFYSEFAANEAQDLEVCVA